MNKFSRYPVVMSLVMGIVTIVWLGFFQVVDDYTKPIIGRIVSAICLIAIAYALEFKPRLQVKGEKLLKGLFLIAIILTLQSLVVVVSVVFAFAGKRATISLQTVIQLALLCFLVAITEEVLCRVIMIHSMIKKWGNNKKGVTDAIVISSIIFGMLHGMHYFTNPGIPLTITMQIINATSMGLAFAVVYKKYDNLWPCIIFHCLYDFGILYSQLLKGQGMVTVGAGGEITLDTIFLTSVIVSQSIIFSIYQLRGIRKNLI